MAIPTENVGSLPRPTTLQQALAAYDAGTITHEQLVAEQDEACRDSIERMEATGVLDRFTAEERVDIGIHTCPGGDRDSVHSAEVPYEKLLRNMFDINAGYLLIQCASERDKEHVYKLCGEYRPHDANGVAQKCFMGVIDPLTPQVETPEQVRDALVTAANSIPAEHLGATDDCGFSPFSTDDKPKHGSPDVARDIAFQKIGARVQGVQMASAQLGV